MQLLAWLPALLTDVVDGMVSNGYVVCLAGVCLLQYVYHVARMSRTRRTVERYQAIALGLEQELASSDIDRQLGRLETGLLRELVAEHDYQVALHKLLRRFVANTSTGLAAFLKINETGAVAQQARGIEEPAGLEPLIDAAILTQLKAGRTVVLQGPSLAKSQLWERLSAEDRRKVRELYIIGAGEPDDPFGVVVSTDLPTTGGTREQRLEIARRALIFVGETLRAKQDLERHKSRTRWTTEMLDLRLVTDRAFDSPTKLIHAFLGDLAQKIQADRAALFTVQGDRAVSGRPTITVGVQNVAGVQERWEQHETRLAEVALGGKELAWFDADRLATLKINDLVAEALAIPMYQAGKPVGVVCFTRRQPGGFAKDRRGLAAWAVEFLGETLLKAASQADVERRARVDGLTQLANRQTFDDRVARELDAAQRTGQPCSLVLIDVDHFKSINDRYGHPGGDQVLKTIAAAVAAEIAKSTRQNDRPLCARYGGEEFAVLLPGVSMNAAERIAESLRSAIAQARFADLHPALHVTASLGVAESTRHGSRIAELVAAADAALYHAKQTGRNRVSSAQLEPAPA